MFQIPEAMVRSVMIGKTGELLFLPPVLQTVKTQEHVNATDAVLLKQEPIQADPPIVTHG